MSVESSTSAEIPSNKLTGLKIMFNEFKKDKLAVASVIILLIIFISVFAGALILDQEEVVRVDLFSIYSPPTSEHLLGTDYGGRDILGQLIIGAKNSIIIGFVITVITGVFGFVVGLVSGYFGGMIDNIIMRIIDFIMILPFLMLVIVFITLIPKFNIVTFIMIMSAFLWVSNARLIRAKTLAEKELDYVSASKMLGASNIRIMYREILPNLTSIIIVNLTLSFAGNIGIESGLSFLGFGLPESTPSLGTLIGYSTNPEVLQGMWWIWLPPSLLILIMMLSINFIGQALKRSGDARQRLG